MKKLEKIERQEQKTREKIAALQAILKQIGGARTEQENLQIIQQVRALKLSREELYAFLGGGELPASLAGALGGTSTAVPETIHSRRERKRKGKQNTEPDDSESNSETETQDFNNSFAENTTNFESEEINHEEQ
jgi:hypothetical protein